MNRKIVALLLAASLAACSQQAPEPATAAPPAAAPVAKAPGAPAQVQPATPAINPNSALAPRPATPAQPFFPAPDAAQVQGAFVEALSNSLLTRPATVELEAYRKAQLARIATATVQGCTQGGVAWDCQVSMQGSTARLTFVPDPNRISGWSVVVKQ